MAKLLRSSAAVPWSRLTLPEVGVRPVGALLRARVLFGGSLQQMGWLFAAFGSIFVWAFGAPQDIAGRLTAPHDLVPVTVTLVSSRAMNMSINEEQVFEHELAWELDGRAHRGVAFTTGPAGATGTLLPAEASRSRPHVEVRGMRTTAAGPFVLFVLLFPLIGLVLAGTTLARNARAVSLLRTGSLARGTLDRVELTNMRVNKQPVRRFVFRFSVEGQAYEVSGDSLDGKRLTDEEEEPILYDPVDPRRAVLLGAIDGDPRLDDQGRFTTSGAPVVVLLPLAFVVCNAIAAVIATS